MKTVTLLFATALAAGSLLFFIVKKAVRRVGGVDPRSLSAADKMLYDRLVKEYESLLDELRDATTTSGKLTSEIDKITGAIAPLRDEIRKLDNVMRMLDQSITAWKEHEQPIWSLIANAPRSAPVPSELLYFLKNNEIYEVQYWHRIDGLTPAQRDPHQWQHYKKHFPAEHGVETEWTVKGSNFVSEADAFQPISAAKNLSGAYAFNINLAPARQAIYDEQTELTDKLNQFEKDLARMDGDRASANSLITGLKSRISSLESEIADLAS